MVNASVITGFVRIANTESAEIPRSSSGSEYNGARWFVESLQPDAGAMQWVAWNGSEDWLQYAHRCKLEADTKGLVRGRHQLGYKVLPDKVENSDAKWMVEPFPAGADMDDLESFLKQQGFLEIKILEKSPRRTGTTWIFRGTRKDRGELIQGRIADDENQKQSLPRQCALGGPKNVPRILHRHLMPHQLSQTKLKRTANKARKHVSIAHNQFHFKPM